MTEKIYVLAGDKLSGIIWQTYGLAVVLEALGGDKPVSTLPGFGLAMALVEREIADLRTRMAGEVYRAAAKAGHDVTKIASIFTSIKDGKPVVEIEPSDLVDAAED